MVVADFDQVLEDIGPFGPYQIYNIVLVGLASLCPGANSLANVFMAGLPDFRCANNDMTSNQTLGDNGDAATCYYTAENSSELQQCTQWEYDTDEYGNTMAMEVRNIFRWVKYVY